MAGLGNLSVELSANIAKFESAMNRAQYIARDNSQAIVKEVQGMRASFDALPGTIAKVYAAFQSLEMVGSIIKKAIGTVDEFQVSIIGIAASLTNMAKPGQGSFAELFQRNKEAATDMYRAITLEAAKHFATANEMMTVYNKMVQSGYAARMDEVEALGILTDVIKLKTRGQDVERQLNTEIMALMEGQARAGSLLAQELKQRLGPEWGKIVDKHKQAGDLVQWIASLYPGISAANKDIEGTINAQWATLKSMLELVAIDGLQGVYQSIVEIIKDTNDYLRENGNIIANKLIAGWVTVQYITAQIKDNISSANQATSMNIPTAPADRSFTEATAAGFKRAFDPRELAGDLLEFLASVSRGIDNVNAGYNKIINTLQGLVDKFTDIYGWEELTKEWEILVEKSGLIWAWEQVQALYNILSRPITWVINTVFSGGGSPGAGVDARKLTTPDKSLDALIKQKQMAAQGVYQMQVPGIGLTDVKSVGFAPPAVENRSPAAKEKKGKKGDGGYQASVDRIQSIIDGLNKEFAKFTQGSIAEVEAWAKKVQDDIEKVGRKGAETAEALTMVEKVKGEKIKKINEDFQVFVGKESGNAYVEIEAQAKAWLTKYKGIKGAETEINYITARMKWEADVKQYSERLTLEKSFYDQAASLAPVFADQVAYKRKALDLEIEINKYTQAIKLAELERNHTISKGQADEYRGMQAILDQQKKYNLEMENNKGVSGWAYGRNKEVEQRNPVKDMMGGLESGISDAWTQGISNAMSDSKSKKSFSVMGKDIVQSMISEMSKKSWTKVWDSVAKMVAPKAPGGAAGGGGDNAAGTLSGAAQLLSSSGIQLGLSAGGLLLSGIGIATNSQALVYAGAFLQVAALAVQVYEMFTATSQLATTATAALALTGSAAALTAAAGAIILASEVDMATSWIPFFHSGGPIYAHGGLNLKSDEVPIIAQTGERVLSRTQNRDYEAGMAAGGGGNGGGLSIGAIHIDARGANKDINWKQVVKNQVAPELKKLAEKNRFRV